MRLRRLVPALLAAPAMGCRPVPPSPPQPAAVPPRGEAPAWISPASYFAAEPTVIERGDDGIDRAIVNGSRLLLRGPQIVGAGPAEQEVDGGGRAPAWATAAGGAAPARYVFWRGKRLFGAESFLGPLVPMGTLPQDPLRSFDWLGGTGLALQGAELVVPPGGGALGRVGVAAAVQAVAADARRALVVTALGHALYTADAGASYRDVSPDLGAVTALGAREGAIVVTTAAGQERVVRADGAIVDRAQGPASAPRRPPPDPDPFADATGRRPLDVAARAGLPTADGGVVIAANGFVGRFDPATGRTTSLAALDAGLRDAECTPVRAGGAILLACVAEGRAAVVDLTGAPRTERTFDLAGASDLTRFVIGDDALGFLGPCDGTSPRVPEHDRERDGAGDPSNASRQQSPVLCVRAGKDDWVEHRLAPAEVEDVAAWIPRSSGGAVAILTRPGPFLDERDRVQVRGALRVVRLARNEPPLALSPWSFEREGNVDDSLRVLADDSIAGFVTGAGNSGNDLAVSIDPAGHVRAYGAPPHVALFFHAGPLALAGGDDGRLWESLDAGQRWSQVDPPPAPRERGGWGPSACSLAGCVVGGFLRIGWTGRTEGAARFPPVDLPVDRRPAREIPHRAGPPTPALRLACAPAGLPEGRRTPDSSGFGYTPQPRPRGGVARIGTLGTAIVPWGNGPQMPTSGDIDLGWVAPLDLTATIHHATLSIARLGLPSSTLRTYDLRTGYLLAPDGGLSVFAVGNGTDCVSRLLEVAGLARPLGACAAERTVGVDLGGRVLLVDPAWNGIHVSVAAVPAERRATPSSGRAGPRAPTGLPPGAAALHEIHVTSAPFVRGISYGAGARAGLPVVVVVDAGGQASLAPVDPDRGTLGAEEPLRPLHEAALGSSPACAPRAGEARVVLPFEGLIALDRASIRGVAPGTSGGVAVLRWSRDRACLDAVELPIHDDRFDESPGPYDPSGTVRKIVARFDGKGDRQGQATLLLVGMGTETRQRLACSALLPGAGEAP